MKKLLGIVVLSLLWCNVGFALDRDKLNELMAKAKTSYAVVLIEDYCAGEKAFLEIMYSKACKCAINVGEANTEYAAVENWRCLLEINK